MRLSKDDVRIAVRSLTRHPGFAITAILSLALAIALNTTMYSFLDALVRPKLDITGAERFYNVAVFRDMRIKINQPDLLAQLLRQRMQTYDAIVDQTVAQGTETVVFNDRLERPLVMHVSDNLFSVYGVRILRGRAFIPSDADAETTPVAISDRLADRLSPNTAFPLDTAIEVEGVRHPVVSIIKGGAFVAGMNHPDVFLPTSSERASAVIRLKPGVTRADAQHEFNQLAAQFALLTGDDPKLTKLDLRPLTLSQFEFHAFHYALIGSVIALLLIACANLANLQLARGIGRSRELALRTALGATRKDIIAQLLLESGVIAVGGLLVGPLLTFWGMHFLSSKVPPSIADYFVEPQISWRLFVVAAVVTLVCVLVIGLIPAIRVSAADPNDMLKSGNGTGATGKHRRQYSAMVVAEIGLSLALLSGAALVVRAALVVHETDLTFDAKPIVHATLWLMGPRDTTFQAAGYINELTTRLRALPEVANVAATYSKRALKSTITVDERGGTPRELDAPMSPYVVTTADYFRTLGISMVKGRNFSDGIAVVPEVVIDEKTARALWPGGDPIGQGIKLGAYASDAPWLRVIGVVRESDPNDLRRSITAQQSRLGAIYVASSVSDAFSIGDHRADFLSIDIRSRNDPVRTLAAVQRALPRGGLVRGASAEPMEAMLGITRERQRHDFVASLFVAFASLALGLASLGVYGIVAHSVAERKREIGVRIALGASNQHILQVVLREGNAVALAGVALGLLLTKFTAGWLDAFIINEDQYNAPVFAMMAVVLFCVVVGSALRPALVATRIDPVESLRCE